MAFYSTASNLIPGGTYGQECIFVKDLTTGALTLVSADASGTPGYSNSSSPVFSPDGTKIAFASYSPNLVPGDTNGQDDVFVANLTTGAVTRVLIETTDGERSWGTVGVSENIIEASWEALVDAIDFGLSGE